MKLISLCSPILVLVLLGALCAPVSAGAAPDFAALDAYLEQQRAAAHVPGLAIGVVQGGEIVHLQGYGVTGPSGQAVTPQTNFILGSVTKGVTALAVMQLVEAGQVDLEAPVDEYLPWFGLSDVTVRHLLNQTSGISTRTGRLWMTDTYREQDAIARHAQKMSAQPRTRPAGDVYEYSNANYVILGALIEAVSGQTYEQYLAAHIFEPLAMRRTYAHELEAEVDGMSSGYVQWLGAPLRLHAPYPAGDVPAGYLVTNAEDMAHYLVAQMNGGAYDGQQVLSAAGVQTLHTGAAPSSAVTKYAMGWEVGTHQGLVVIDHRGDVANYHTNIILLPEHELGLVLLANANSTVHGERINQIAWDAARLLAGLKPLPLEPEPMIRVVIGFVAAVVLATLVLIGLSVRTLRRRAAGRKTSRVGAAALVLLLALIAALTLIGMPAMFGAPIPVMLLFSPDLGWPAIGAGVLAGVGALLLVGLLAVRPRAA
ncbi:MAG TPA: serine hydrolase domain-containing protein [Anaerolineaceae bacterium]|nr:serine hydrolase domain-containing protein [Anaerolineaceae bacterium]